MSEWERIAKFFGLDEETLKKVFIPLLECTKISVVEPMPTEKLAICFKSKSGGLEFKVDYIPLYRWIRFLYGSVRDLSREHLFLLRLIINQIIEGSVGNNIIHHDDNEL